MFPIRVRPVRSLSAAVGCVLATALSGAACRGTSAVEIEIAVPEDVVADTAWFEVGAFKDARCDALRPMLAGGVPPGAAARVAFKRDADVTPRIGDIAAGEYAFGAVARGKDCAVLATGCFEGDVNDTELVDIPMGAIEEPTGSCGHGATCAQGRCVPDNDNSKNGVGAGCSLELLGSGPLANTAEGTGAALSPPAIAATPAGFVIVYREESPGGSTPRLHVLPIDDGGGALPPRAPQTMPSRCTVDGEPDGVALFINPVPEGMGGDGVKVAGQIVAAKPPCGKAPALEVYGFRVDREFLEFDGAYIANGIPAPGRLSSGRSAAARGRAGGVVVSVEGGLARARTVLPGGRIPIEPTGTFGATTGVTGAWVASSERVLALLAAVAGAPTAPSPQAGGPASSVPSGDASANLRLTMMPVIAPLSELVADGPRRAISFPGEWGSVAAVAGRVIVVSNGSGPDRAVTLRTFDIDKPEPVDATGFGLDGRGPATSADVAIVNDRAFVAALKEEEVALHVYANATTTPTPLRHVAFAKEPRIAAIANVHDGRVAVAATPRRVAVTWTTSKVLRANDPVGGYAVFACTE